MSLQEVQKLLQAALESSFYLSPKDPGLTYDELFEVGRRGGYQDGEIGDALRPIATRTFGDTPQRLHPNPHVMQFWAIFSHPKDPDYGNINAFDFVFTEMNAAIKSLGGTNARLERNAVVERGAAKNIPRLDVEAAITVLVASGQLIEENGQLRSRSGRVYEPLPSAQRRPTMAKEQYDEARAQAYSLVRDIVARRTDGRPKHAEPLDAFAESLEQLGYGSFRLWWIQIVAELRRNEPQSSPVSALVLSAALVEGALTFVVKHARQLGLGVLGSKSFAEDPRTWKIDDLVSSAAAGRDTAILDDSTRRRAEGLISARQRIHAGRMLSQFPGGAPDLRPEEAREAKAVAEQVVRRTIDWLEKYPPTGSSSPS